MKVSAARATQKQSPVYDAENIVFESLFDTPKFLRFKGKVEDVIRKSKKELTVREIRERLGQFLVDKWLGDALELLTDKTIIARQKTAQITVYSYLAREAKEVPTLAFNHGNDCRKSLPYMQL